MLVLEAEESGLPVECTLSCVPPEVLNLIQNYLDPIDILSLRLTSKRMSICTLDRTVWTTSLQQVCSIHGLFKPTFILQEMTQHEIEHAALAPVRFAQSFLLKRPNKQPETPQSYMTRVLAVPETHSSAEALTDIHILPGGRYLLTETPRRIDLWDLGPSSASYSKPVVVASYLAPEPYFLIYIKPTPDGFGFYLILEETTPGVSDLVVYTAYPLSSSEFVKIRSLTISPHQLGIYSTSSSLAAFEHEGDGDFSVTAWDFIQDLTSTWIVEGPSSDMLICHDEYVVTVDDYELTIWRIPKLRSHANDGSSFYSHPDAIYLGPMYRIFHPHYDWQPQGTTHVLWDEWTQGKSGFRLGDNRKPAFFSVLVLARGNPQFSLSRYIIESGPDDSTNIEGAPTITIIPLLSLDTEGTDTDVTSFCDAFPLRPCDKWLVQPWMSSRGDAVSTIVVDLTAPELGTYRTVQLYKGETEFAGPHCAFCPATGRLCLLKSGSREIQIIDFSSGHGLLSG